MGTAQWFPIPSMSGVVVMSNSLMLPIKKEGIPMGAYLGVGIPLPMALPNLFPDD